ncbi:hypothetical protein ColTof4_00645 [Colletotrichum tofieldiae]|nr:hypothetical protein ColTof3_07856 [Colletotrichum tofieldiae]GKT68222.1 hypothetical protein ColTof4_00645 [Colletotrichum tofieldiae]
MANLASACSHQGRLDEAEKLEVRVMKLMQRAFGKERSETPTSMSNLATTYLNQSRWKEAEKLGMQVM